MALWTLAEVDTLKAAVMEAAIAGTAEYSVPGRSKRNYSLDELTKLLRLAQEDVASQPGFTALRTQKIQPYYP